MDDKLKGTINKIVQLTQQNLEFGTELRKALEIKSSANAAYTSSVLTHIQAIREALEIRANCSITYDFIKEERIRNQLIIDNLRMENAALNLKEVENERFYVFCVNAFYQIENVINYYYHKTSHNIKELLSKIVEATQYDGEGKYAYKPTGKEESVGDIPIACKLNAFCNTFFHDDNIKITYANLRKVRNEGEHRCMTIIKNQNEDDSFYRFFKYNSFNSIRRILIKLVCEVRKQLTLQKEENTQIDFSKELEGTITTMLPSTCFIDIDGNKQQLNQKFFKKVQGLKKGDKVKVTLWNNKITDIGK
jgi:hypothetical protein